MNPFPPAPPLAWPAPPPGPLSLPAHEVHLWCVAVSRVAEPDAAWDALLSDAELQRAGRFHAAQDRRRYRVARGLLRRLLGRYLDLPPASLRLLYGAQGKPRLCPTQAARPVHFNLSHSADLVLYGFSASEAAIGVDIERSQAMPDLLDIAQRFFSPRESQALAALPPAQRQDAFFRCWSRKEAYVKALGTGLTQPLDSFDVTLLPDAPARLSWQTPPAQAWSLHGLEPCAGYHAALAIAGAAPRLRCWQLTPDALGRDAGGAPA